jgi:CubicO group peptidase (beta-lactamase class C family)
MSLVSRISAAALAASLSLAIATPLANAGSLPRAKPAEVGFSAERLARIGPAMQRHIEAGEIAGVVTLVARRGRIAHFEAYGYADAAKRTPMRTDHIFQLASSSKPITATAIMMLVESGDVRLADPVSKFIPEFGAPPMVAVPKPGGPEGSYDLVPASRPITVGDLLKHGSGLVSGGLAASTEDYLQFVQMLLNGGELDGERLLGPRTVELMTANHTGDMVNGQFGRPARGMGFGLGMQVVLDPVAAELAVSKGAFSWPGGTGVAWWAEPAEDMVTIFFIQGGTGGPARTAFENAVRQAIVD